MTETTEVAAPTEAAPEVSTNDRDDLVAAANEAIATETAAESPKKPEPVSKDGEPADLKEPVAEAPPVTMSTVARAIREAKERDKMRIEARQQNQEQASKIAQEREQMARERAQFEQHARALEAERAQIIAAKQDISKYAEFSGKTQQQIAQELMIAGSPEHQVMLRQQAKLEALEAKIAEQDNAWQQHQSMLKEQSARAKAAERNKIEHDFTAITSDASKYPMVARMPPALRIAWGDQIADEYSAATNRIASYDMIADYMQHSLTGGTEQQASTQSKVSNGKAPTNRANGPRTLSNSVASERRSSPKPISNNLSPEELRKELIAVAQEAALTST